MADGWLTGTRHARVEPAILTRHCPGGNNHGAPCILPYLVVGAGIHGLSTAYHLAKELKARGLGCGHRTSSSSTSTSPGAGASGIACGVVRNNYYQPAMAELMQACVEVWESDPAAYHYNPVGYIALGADRPGAPT